MTAAPTSRKTQKALIMTLHDIETGTNPASADTRLIHDELQRTHMNVPERLREADQRDAVIREYEDDHTAAIVVDFGPESTISTDVVDETVIVVVGDDHFEFALPDDAGELSANNGVLTIEG